MTDLVINTLGTFGVSYTADSALLATAAGMLASDGGTLIFQDNGSAGYLFNGFNFTTPNLVFSLNRGAIIYTNTKINIMAHNSGIIGQSVYAGNPFPPQADIYWTGTPNPTPVGLAVTPMIQICPDATGSQLYAPRLEGLILDGESSGVDGVWHGSLSAVALSQGINTGYRNASIKNVTPLNCANGHVFGHNIQFSDYYRLNNNTVMDLPQTNAINLAGNNIIGLNFDSPLNYGTDTAILIGNALLGYVPQAIHINRPNLQQCRQGLAIDAVAGLTIKDGYGAVYQGFASIGNPSVSIAPQGVEISGNVYTSGLGPIGPIWGYNLYSFNDLDIHGNILIAVNGVNYQLINPGIPIAGAPLPPFPPPLKNGRWNHNSASVTPGASAPIPQSSPGFDQFVPST